MSKWRTEVDSNTSTGPHSHISLWLTMVVFILVSGFILFSYSLAKRMVEGYSPLIDATMELKLEATTAHLWFEEILNGDRGVELDAVRANLDQADWYAQAMLRGGENEEGRFVPLDDEQLRRHIGHVREELENFAQMLEQRWRTRQASSHDVTFDATFDRLIAETDLVETRLQQLTADALETFERLQLILLSLTVLLGLFTGALLRNHLRQRGEQLWVTERANEELRHEIERRRKAEAALKQQADTDMLTGLFNRSCMTRLLEEELSRSERYGGSCSIVMFDIDHFKLINDSQGHQVGDQVLQQLAEVVSGALRENDSFARWGGEEFLLLLPQTHLAGALELAGRCRERLAGAHFTGQGRVTASFGVAEQRDGEGVDALLLRADKALYRAKNAGRDQVVSAEAG